MLRLHKPHVHDWRPDPIYLFGVCRTCGVPSDKPQPCQAAELDNS